MRVEFTMTNDELVKAIEAAFQLLQRMHGFSASYPKTLAHYHSLLEIQQQRAAQFLAKDDFTIPEPT